MDVAALILWILTAGGGFFLLATWITKGGARRDGPGSKFPPPVIFGHFLLAALGLVLWIVYVATDSKATGWTAFVLLALVALLGFTMFARWIPTYRSGGGRPGPAHVVAGRRPAGTTMTETSPQALAGPAERHFPVAVVAGHGLLAASTLVLVLLTMLGIGGS